MADGKCSGTSFIEQWIEENKDKNLVKPKDWNLISAFKFRVSKLDPIWLAIVGIIIGVGFILYFGWNFVYQKYIPITDSLSVLVK